MNLILMLAHYGNQTRPRLPAVGWRSSEHTAGDLRVDRPGLLRPSNRGATSAITEANRVIGAPSKYASAELFRIRVPDSWL